MVTTPKKHKEYRIIYACIKCHTKYSMLMSDLKHLPFKGALICNHPSIPLVFREVYVSIFRKAYTNRAHLKFTHPSYKKAFRRFERLNKERSKQLIKRKYRYMKNKRKK